jgi:hypothetical protein
MAQKSGANDRIATLTPTAAWNLTRAGMLFICLPVPSESPT